MNLHEYQRLLTHPAAQLVGARNAPMVLGFFHRAFKLAHRVTIAEGEMRGLLENFSRLGHARALYDFFETPANYRKQDDAICEDFGFPARPIPRPAEDRARLNKQLFHITYSRLRFNETSKPWPDSILGFLHGRCVEFIEHLLEQRALILPPTDLLAWRSLLARLKSGHQLQISRQFLPSGLSPIYVLRFGEKLDTGYSELTRPRASSQQQPKMDAESFPNESRTE